MGILEDGVESLMNLRMGSSLELDVLNNEKGDLLADSHSILYEW
jgi:hypothetical protein